MTSIVVERYAQALYELTHKADEQKLTQVVSAFVRLFAKRGLLPKLELLIDAFQHYAEQEDNRRRLSLTVAHSLEHEMRQRLASHDPRLSDARVTVDQGIIGGLIIRDGSTIIDASVKRQCRELHHRFNQ